MNLQEAYALLEVSPDISSEDLKKKYKQLAKQFHPDVNKEAGAEEKFKSMSEAYQNIEKARNNPQPQGFGINLQDMFGGFADFIQKRQRKMVSNIELKEKISFRESILGADRVLKYTRDEKCGDCNGNGKRVKNTNCQYCGGSGVRTTWNGNSVFSTPCQCRATASVESCPTCQEKGTHPKEISLTVQIPPGVSNNNTMQLSGAGNFVENSIFGDSYSNLLLHLEVEQHPSLKVENQDLIYPLSISLKEALQGKMVEVPTIDGEKLVEIPPLSRHKEEVVLNNLGLGRKGSQRIILDVSYPTNTKSLIEQLGDV